MQSEQRVLGKDSESFEIDGLEDNRTVSLSMATQARRSIDLFSHDLDPALYDNAEFTQTLTQLATSNRNARIRILVLDPARAIKEGHQLLETARRLTSFIEIRQPAREQRDAVDALLIVDATGMIRRPLATSYRAQVSFNAPAEAQQQLRLFDAVWAHAEVPADLRRLHL